MYSIHGHCHELPCACGGVRPIVQAVTSAISGENRDAMIGRGDAEIGAESEGGDESGPTTSIREEVDVAIIGKK